MINLNGSRPQDATFQQQVPDLIWEFTVGATGTDDTAVALWCWLVVQQQPDEVRFACERAAFHWEASDEDTRIAIGAHYGLGEPTKERCPLPSKIAADYGTVLALMTTLLDDEPHV